MKTTRETPDEKDVQSSAMKWDSIGAFKNAFKEHHERKHTRHARQHDYSDLLLSQISDSEEWENPASMAHSESQPLMWDNKTPLSSQAKRPLSSQAKRPQSSKVKWHSHSPDQLSTERRQMSIKERAKAAASSALQPAQYSLTNLLQRQAFNLKDWISKQAPRRFSSN